MKQWVKYFSLLFAVIFISSCATLTEEYRFKKRFDKFYNFMEKSEATNFVNKDFKAVGESIDKRISQDTNLSQSWDIIKDGEAISTFSSSQTADFFYTILLREINRENYRNFMSSLSAEEQLTFALGKNYQTVLGSKLTRDKRFQKLIEKSKTEFRLYGFSDAGVFDFFFEISYPEISRKQFYYFCDAIRRAGVIKQFVLKDVDAVVSGMQKYSKSNPFFKKYLKNIRKNASLTELSDAQLVAVYHEIAFNQMDKDAAFKTLSKFIKLESF